jgi:hypothetical protein
MLEKLSTPLIIVCCKYKNVLKRFIDHYSDVGICIYDNIFCDEHHSELERLWKERKELILRYPNEHILYTTQSYEIIKAAVNAFEDNQNLISYVRIDLIDGELKFKEFTYNMLKLAIDCDLEIR